ncbi:MAG: type I glyceraldehyde-3-phosphate dehydrogenase [Deltaproteobacteria bacterium]|nr:type I glyceraldehyde-3-phosphate dehydrogenase [Deltaproteobacteria bacterium]
MSKKIAINGFGRIGRCVLRALKERPELDLDVVAINDLTDAKTLAHLLRYDSVHGRFDKSVEVVEGGMLVDGDHIAVSAEKDPAKLPWAALGVELVLECTGRFTNQADCAKHLTAGAKRVLLSAPTKNAEDDEILTVVYGINQHQYDPAKYTVVSNASCTTNCLAPVVKVLNDTFGIVHGQMTTVHAYTNDQSILDLPHKDLRRARAAGLSMIPTSTGAAKAIGLVIPELKGRLDGFSIRVPTPDVSMVVLNVRVNKKTSREEVNKVFAEAANGALKGVLDVSHEPLVSMDYVHNPFSAVVDAALTQVLDGDFVTVSAWYDNEWGFSCRMLDTMAHILKHEG